MKIEPIKDRSGLMESTGIYLKNQREGKGVSLKDIADATHISLRFLEAIEREEFHRLPGEIFVKGFTKSYAEYLGLDSVKVMEEYKKRFEIPEPVAEDKTAESAQKDMSIVLNREWKKYWPVMAGFILLMAISYYLSDFVIGNKETPHRPDTIEERTEPVKKADAPDPVQKVELIIPQGVAESPEAQVADKTPSTASPPVEPEKTEGGQARPGSPAGPPEDAMPADQQSEKEATATLSHGSLTLKMVASKDAWMLIRIDSSEDKKDFILKEGETVTFEAERKFSITTGNASGVKLFLNEKELAWPKSGNVIHDFIAAMPEVQE